jgi:hypothetical protein
LNQSFGRSDSGADADLLILFAKIMAEGFPPELTDDEPGEPGYEVRPKAANVIAAD